MDYQALSIDTQTIYANGGFLDRGLIAELSQFQDHHIQVVLSEIVCREIRKLLAEKAKATIEALEKSIKDGTANGLLAADQISQLNAVREALPAPSSHATTQLNSFIEATGAQIIPADSAPIDVLLNAYFDRKAPFSNKGKKAEFPDAFILLSLEAWAKSQVKKILLVSKDSDWKEFAASSPWLDCVEDLAQGLEILVAAADAVKEEAKALLSIIKSRSHVPFNQVLDSQIDYWLSLETPRVEYASDFYGDDDGASLSLIDYKIGEDGEEETEIKIVRRNELGFSMRVPIYINAVASTFITFSIYDSVDKDMVPMGSQTIEQEIDFDAYVIIGFQQNLLRVLSEEPVELKDRYNLYSAQLTGVPKTVDLDYVDFSLADEDYDS